MAEGTPKKALTSASGAAGGEAADGNAGRIDLVDKTRPHDTEGEQERPEKPAPTVLPEDEVPQETRPMPAAVWPPPQAAAPTQPSAPTSPPSLRRQPVPDPAARQTEPQARPGLFTSELRRALPPWAYPLLTSQPIAVWLGARIGLSLLALLAVMMIPAIAPAGTANWYDSPGGPELTPIVDAVGGAWTRWDGQWYLKIATEGYRADDGSAAFYPLYPWTVTIMGWLAGERFIWAGIVVSTVFFLLALVLLHRLVRLDFHHEDAGRTVFYIAAFPMAFFFWAVYSESLFLLLSVAALLAMRTQRFWWAALAVSLAIWTRSTGLLLLLPMAWELWRAYRPPVPTDPRAIPPSRPRRYTAASLAVPFAALLAFMGWAAFVFGDALAPLTAQQGWNRRFSWPWQTIADAWGAAAGTPLQFQPENQSWTYLASLLVALVLGAIAIRWLRGSYTIYLWAGLLFPLFSGTRINPLLSYPRFLAVLFPIFIVLALMGRNRYMHQIITWASLLLLALYTIRFVNWYWVA
jgi:hypothetical protein